MYKCAVLTVKQGRKWSVKTILRASPIISTVVPARQMSPISFDYNQFRLPYYIKAVNAVVRTTETVVHHSRPNLRSSRHIIPEYRTYTSPKNSQALSYTILQETAGMCFFRESGDTRVLQSNQQSKQPSSLCRAPS